MNPWLTRYLYVVATISALTIAFATEPLPGPARNMRDSEGWLVPRLAPAPSGSPSVITELVQSRLWGGQRGAIAEVDEKAARWRLAGVTGKPNDRYVIVQFGDDRIQQLKAKDQFPDGTVIAEVRENGVCVILQGKRRLLPLDGQLPAITW